MNADPKNVRMDTLRNEDLNEVVEKFCFPWTSSDATKVKWNAYFYEQSVGDRIVCLVRWQDQLIGYGSLLKNSKYPGFKTNGIPEIHDVWIAEKYRGNGFGKQLICYLEWIAKNESYQSVGLGVGLYKDYGRAQRLYIRLGYMPDGEGVTYQYLTAIPGNSYPLDDDFILWLKKDL